MAPVEHPVLTKGTPVSAVGREELCGEQPDKEDKDVNMDVVGFANDSQRFSTMMGRPYQLPVRLRASSDDDVNTMKASVVSRSADSLRAKETTHLLKREKKLPAKLGDIYQVRRNVQSLPTQYWSNLDDHDLFRRRSHSTSNRNQRRVSFGQDEHQSSAWRPPSSGSNGFAADSLEEQAENIFSELDTNLDGYLDEVETSWGLQQALDRTLHLAGNKEKNHAGLVHSWLRGAGKNRSGKTNMEDFKNILRSILRSEHAAMLRKNVPEAGQSLQGEEKKTDGSNRWVCDRWVFNPNGNFHLFWNLGITLFSIILIVSLPLTLGWEHGFDLSRANIVMEACFMVDVALNFYTGYIDGDDLVVMDLALIRRHYIKGWFAVDFLSSFPADIIFAIANLMNVQFSLLIGKTFLKSLKVLRVAKVVRLGRSSPLAEVVRSTNAYLETDLKFTTPALLGRLLSLFGLTFTLSHWMGSLQFLVVRLNGFPEDSWAAMVGLENETKVRQWCWSWFRGLAQLILLGFESPPFTNTSCDTLTDWCEKEHWMTLGCLYIGAVYYSFLISTVLSIIQSNSLTKTAYQQRLGELNEYIKKRDLPTELSYHIRDHFNLNYTSHMFFDESEVVKSMSQHQIQSIRRHCARRLIEVVPILGDRYEVGFTRCVTGYLKEVRVGLGQTIFQEHEVGDAMYFIMRGSVHLKASFESCGDIQISEGSFFGEVSLLKSVPRTMTAVVGSKHCCLFRLDKESLFTVLELFADTKRRFLRIARRRLDMVKHAEDPIRVPRPESYGDPENDGFDPEDAKIQLFQRQVRVLAEELGSTSDEADDMDISQMSESKRE